MKSPEAIELAKKRQELAGLLEEQSRCELDLATIKSEIRIFERAYEQVLGARITELEQLEWQISGFLGSDAGEEHHKYYHAADNGSSSRPIGATTSLLDDDPDTTSVTEEKSTKALYREVAKAIHPDLALDDNQRARRQELMAVANQAYKEGDRRGLQRLLREWQLGPKTTKGLDIGAELVRLIRQLAHVRQTIQELRDRITELLDSDIHRFKQRVEDALSDGIDLLAEMAATVDLDLAKARKRLALLKGEPEPVDERQTTHLETRIVRFPSDQSYGTLYLRAVKSVDYRDWQKLGAAKGAREIPLNMALRLDVRGDGVAGLSFLGTLGAHDLQALFLYDVGDDALERICQLSGLQELYLSNTTVSDAGLKQLASLTGLKRLYLYHTDISDAGLINLLRLKKLKWLTFSGTRVTEAGLSALRKGLPDCKVVTFKWRYE